MLLVGFDSVCAVRTGLPFHTRQGPTKLLTTQSCLLSAQHQWVGSPHLFWLYQLYSLPPKMYLLPILVKILILHTITRLIDPALLITIIYLCVCSPPDNLSSSCTGNDSSDDSRYLPSTYFWSKVVLKDWHTNYNTLINAGVGILPGWWSNGLNLESLPCPSASALLQGVTPTMLINTLVARGRESWGSKAGDQ